MHVLRLGTRGSALARWQTDHTIARLRAAGVTGRVETRVFATRGDMDAETPLPAIGGKGLFTEELARALRNGEIEAAVHSLKDLPTEPPPGLTIGAVFGRTESRDALVSRGGLLLADLSPGDVVGTSSLRRTAQLLAVRPDLVVRPIRGNVETRVGKVEAGEYAAGVLAAAGLERLGLAAHVSEYLDIDAFLPAPGQGALAVQCRADDEATLPILSRIDDPVLRAATAAERTFLAALGGGCSLPVAALAEPAGSGDLLLRGFVGAVTGERTIRVSAHGSLHDATSLGAGLAEEALRQGARALLS